MIGQSDAAITKATDVSAAVEDANNDLGDDFLFDLASRFNEALTANIDSLDTALLAIAGGVLAISALAIDKIRSLERGFGLGAIIALGCALVACAAAYAIGTGLLFTGRSRKDGTEPKAFLQDYTVNPDETVLLALRDLTVSSEDNLTIRGRKRIGAVLSLLLLLLGTGFFAVAQISQKVVESANETSLCSQGCPLVRGAQSPRQGAANR